MKKFPRKIASDAGTKRGRFTVTASVPAECDTSARLCSRSLTNHDREETQPSNERRHEPTNHEVDDLKVLSYNNEVNFSEFGSRVEVLPNLAENSDSRETVTSIRDVKIIPCTVDRTYCPSSDSDSSELEIAHEAPICIQNQVPLTLNSGNLSWRCERNTKRNATSSDSSSDEYQKSSTLSPNSRRSYAAYRQISENDSSGTAKYLRVAGGRVRQLSESGVPRPALRAAGGTPSREKKQVTIEATAQVITISEPMVSCSQDDTAVITVVPTHGIDDNKNSVREKEEDVTGSRT